MNPKDIVEIRGYRTVWHGESAVVAFEIEKQGSVIKMRDADGRHIWSIRRLHMRHMKQF